MKSAILLLVSVCCAPALFAQWAVTKISAYPLAAQSTAGGVDFLLDITLKNETDTTLYVRGIAPAWFMVEAFVRPKNAGVWERQNNFVDRKLEMLPVAPGSEFTVTRRESSKHVGWEMLLTFQTANSALDLSGGREVLVGPFEVPGVADHTGSKKGGTDNSGELRSPPCLTLNVSQMRTGLILAVAFAVMPLGCVHQPKLGILASSSFPLDELAVLEAVYRHLFDHNYSGMQKRAKAYCLSIIQGHLVLEPDRAFLARFDDVQTPVRGRSRFRQGSDLVFSVSAMEKKSEDVYRVEAGYYEGPVSASSTVFVVRLQNGRWHVSKDPTALELISERANSEGSAAPQRAAGPRLNKPA